MSNGHTLSRSSRTVSSKLPGGVGVKMTVQTPGGLKGFRPSRLLFTQESGETKQGPFLDWQPFMLPP